nr:DDE-type integrase/transposase/recombinase [uncultured Pedobacter sp.]
MGSDITYLGNRKEPCYLALVTDAYSKTIVGYDVSDSLGMDGSIKVLKMAISKRKYKTTILTEVCNTAAMNISKR